MKRSLSLLLVAGLGLTGCRAAVPLPPRPVEPDLQLGAMAHRTDFELAESQTSRVSGREAVMPEEEGPAPPPPAGDPAAGTAGSATTGGGSEDPPWPTGVDRLDNDKDQQRRLALFWSGVGILAAGLVSTAAFMTTGQVVEARLDEGYDEGGLSRDREQRLRRMGTVSNQAAIVSGGVSVIGLALLLAGYGLDYSVCGKLAKRRKKCRKR